MPCGNLKILPQSFSYPENIKAEYIYMVFQVKQTLHSLFEESIPRILPYSLEAEVKPFIWLTVAISHWRI